MKKTYVEEWGFTITVVKAGRCRMGMEVGDTFTCTYDCPAGFCPKTMAALHTLCDVARSGGDYRLLGGKSEHEIDFMCADGEHRFHLVAERLI